MDHWETCPRRSLLHYLLLRIDPQNSHSDWYGKWGKISR